MADRDQMADPLVPAEVDLRDFGFMPLHVGKLRDSELVDLSTGDEFKAAVLLWCYAWHQLPCGSLPNDDRILAARSGAGPAWRKVKAMALRGFVECSDGRLYHPLIAEASLDAWARRDAFQVQQQEKDSRQKRWRAELSRLCGLLRDAGVTPPERPTKRVLVDMCRLHVPGFVDASVDGDVDAGETGRGVRETAKTGTGTGTGTDNTHTASPTDGARVCLALKRAGISDVNPGHPDLLALIAAGATDIEFIGAAQTALDRGKGFAYALGTLKRQRVDAAKSSNGMHRGPLPAGSADRKTRQLEGAAVLTGASRAAPKNEPETIDVPSRVIAS